MNRWSREPLAREDDGGHEAAVRVTAARAEYGVARPAPPRGLGPRRSRRSEGMRALVGDAVEPAVEGFLHRRVAWHGEEKERE